MGLPRRSRLPYHVQPMADPERTPSGTPSGATAAPSGREQMRVALGLPAGRTLAEVLGEYEARVARLERELRELRGLLESAHRAVV